MPLARLDDNQIERIAIDFVEELMRQQGDPCRLLSPENLEISEKGIFLRHTCADDLPEANGPHAGYSAPEACEAPEASEDDVSEAGAVYYVGALLYTLKQRTPPPDAKTRAAGAPALPGDNSPLGGVINRAMQMDKGMRIPSLAALRENLVWAKNYGKKQ